MFGQIQVKTQTIAIGVGSGHAYFSGHSEVSVGQGTVNVAHGPVWDSFGGGAG